MNLYVAVDSCKVCNPEVLNVIGVFVRYEDALGECKEPECDGGDEHLFRVQAVEVDAIELDSALSLNHSS